MARVVFFGSPDFAVPSLEKLAAGPMRPVLVVTQPDRPAGRGRRPRPTPVHLAAAALGLETAVAGDLRGSETLERIEAAGADFFAVAAFGLIFPGKVLRMPTIAPVNLHASLLPAWRGASPVNMAIANGDGVTGISTMRMVAMLDAGPVYMRREVEIGSRETAGELSERLSREGAPLLEETLRRIESEGLEPVPQPEEGASYAPRLKKADAEIPWRLDAVAVHDHIRGMNPWPGSRTHKGNATIKVLDSEPVPGRMHGAEPGIVLTLSDEAVEVACGSGSVRLLVLQAEGRRAMPAGDFLRGFRLCEGERFEEEERS